VAEDTVQLRLTIRDEVSRSLNEMSRALRQFDQSVNFTNTQNQLRSVTLLAERFGREIGTVFRMMGAASILSSGGIVASLGLMATGLRNFAREGLQLHYTARDIGMTAGQLSTLAGGLQAAGDSAQDAISSIADVAKAIEDARRLGSVGSPLIQELLRTPGGIQFWNDLSRELESKGTPAAMQFLAERINRLQSEGRFEAARRLRELFGASPAFAEGVKLMGQIRERIAPDDKKAQAFLLAWTNLDISVGNVATRIGAAFLPAFERLFNQLDQFLQTKEGEQFLQRIEGWGTRLEEEAQRFARGEGTLRDIWNQLKESVAGLTSAFKQADEVVQAMGGWGKVLAILVAIRVGAWLGTIVIALGQIAKFKWIFPMLPLILAARDVLSTAKTPEELQKDIDEAKKRGPETLRQGQQWWLDLFRKLNPFSQEQQRGVKFGDVQLGAQDEQFVDFLNDLKVNMDDFLAHAPLSENIEDRRFEHRQKQDLRDNFQQLHDELLRLNNILGPPEMAGAPGETTATPSTHATGVDDPYGSGTINRPAGSLEHMQKFGGMARHVPPPMSLAARVGGTGIEQQIKALRGTTIEAVGGIPQPEAFSFATPTQHSTGLEDPYGTGTINRPPGMELEFNPFANRPFGFAGFGAAGTGRSGGLIGRGAISPGIPVGPRQGKASWFGNFPDSLGSTIPGGWYDPGDINKKTGAPLPNWAGYPQSTPGVAIPFAGAAGAPGAFQGMPVRVQDLTRTSRGVSQLARAIDLGPSQHLPVSREKAIDVNAALAERFGYAGTARQARATGRPEFPTGGQFGYQVITPDMFLRTRQEMDVERRRAEGRPIPFTRHPGAMGDDQASLAPLLAQESQARALNGNAAIDINVKGVRSAASDSEPEGLFRDVNIRRSGQMDPTGGSGQWDEDSGITYD
jgi:hypothetical protein